MTTDDTCSRGGRAATPDRAALFEALRATWTADTSAAADEWSADNRARGQCDVTSLVVMEYLGGDLLLAAVSGGTEPEYHYWNRIGDDDIDLTGEQFTNGETLSPPEVVSADDIRNKFPGARAELRERHARLLSSVADHLGHEPAWPLPPVIEP